MNKEDVYLDRLISIVDVTRQLLAEQQDGGMPWISPMDELAELFEQWGLPTETAPLEQLSRAEIEEMLSC